MSEEPKSMIFDRSTLKSALVCEFDKLSNEDLEGIARFVFAKTLGLNNFGFRYSQNTFELIKIPERESPEWGLLR